MSKRPYNKYPPDGPGGAATALWLACAWLAIVIVGLLVYRAIF
jgi:hypothetical protein